MQSYEEETGKKALWRGKITEGFKKWQKGEKIYPKGKERINILVTEEKKNKWQNFANSNDISTLSKLIREAVDFYIEKSPRLSELNTFNEYLHELKENLNSIKGFSHLLIENYKDDLNWDILLKIKEIFDKSLNLEKIIKKIIKPDTKNLQYDILIVDDDHSTITLLKEYFEKKGYKCKDVSLGTEALELLNIFMPKLILLDILLPDINGHEICKKIKSNDKLKRVPLYYITAVPESEIYEKINESGADGFFLKPFDMNEFNNLIGII